MRRATGRLRAPIGIVAALLALVTVLAACGGRSAARSSTAPPSSAPVSQPAAALPPVAIRTFMPFGAGVPLTAQSVHGSCWTASIAVNRPLAYRCFAGSQILDPCFAHAGTDRAVTCFADPWTRGVRVTVSRPLPADQTLLGSSRPWALQLANGARCVTATGVVGRIGATVLLYRCGSNAAAGTPSRGSHPGVRYALGTRLQTVAVRVMWNA